MKEGEPWIQETSKEAMLADFEGWGTDIINMLRVRPPAALAYQSLTDSLLSGPLVHRASVQVGTAPDHPAAPVVRKRPRDCQWRRSVSPVRPCRLASPSLTVRFILSRHHSHGGTPHRK